MSIAQAAPIVSLREIAARAHEHQQAQVAEALRVEIGRKRAQLIADTLAALKGAFVANEGNQHQGVDWTLLSEAQLAIVGGDARVAERVDLCSVEIDFLGERFEYHRAGGVRNEMALYHLYTCPTCGEIFESDYPVSSLADLGSWLASVAERCQHGGQS